MGTEMDREIDLLLAEAATPKDVPRCTECVFHGKLGKRLPDGNRVPVWEQHRCTHPVAIETLHWNYRFIPALEFAPGCIVVRSPAKDKRVGESILGHQVELPGADEGPCGPSGKLFVRRVPWWHRLFPRTRKES